MVHPKTLPQQREMIGSDVVELLQILAQNHLDVWFDGGWGVDALLGQQTRPHGDLDILIQHKDVPKLRELLGAKGYKDVPRDDTRDCNFVLSNAHGREVDVHSFTFDAAGNWIYEGIPYQADSLSGTGSVNGYSVKCVSPEWMINFHSGYELDMDDYHDVFALCQRFGFEIPPDFDKFK